MSGLMTVNATILGALLILPLLLLCASALKVQIPLSGIVLTLLILLVPAAIGMAIRRFNIKAAKRIGRIRSGMDMSLITFMFCSGGRGTGSSCCKHLWPLTPPPLCLACLGSASTMRWRMHSDWARDAHAISLETGIRNAPLAIAIIVLTFPAEPRQAILAVVALYGLPIVLASTLMTLVFRTARLTDEQGQ